MQFPPSVDGARARRLANPPAPLTPQEAAEWRAQLVSWQARDLSPAQARHLTALSQPGTLAVLVGQQPALLGGPLYTLIKTACALNMAETLSRQWSSPVVPILWLASDDHDFEEVRGASWLDAESQRVAMKLAATHPLTLDPHEAPQRPDAFHRRPMWARPFDATVAEDVVARLTATTPPTEFRDHALSLVRDSLVAGATLETHTARLMLEIFADAGLLIVAPRQPWLRRRAAVIVRRELSDPLASTHIVAESIARWQQAHPGQTPALHRAPNAVNVFHDLDGVRRRLRYEHHRFEVEADVDRWEPIDALALLETDPDRWSPNVVTRPVVQDAALPTVAYLAGPGERAYLELTADLWDAWGVSRPAYLARPHAVFIEPRVRRSLDRLALGITDVIPANAKPPMGDAAASAQLAFLAWSGSTDGLLGAWRRSLPSTYSKTGGALDKLQQHLATGRQRVEESWRADAERDDAERLKHWEKVRAALVPNGEPQERSANLVAPFLIGYGDDQLKRLPQVIPASACDSPTWWRVDWPIVHDAAPTLLGTLSPAAIWAGGGI